MDNFSSDFGVLSGDVSAAVPPTSGRMSSNASLTHNNSAEWGPATNHSNWPTSGQGIEAVTYYLHILGNPVIVLVGIMGNALSFSMFVRRPLKFQPASIYLAFLNLVDTGLLLTIFLAWLIWFDVDVLNRQGGCQTFTYATYVFSFLSVWTVVSFTVERYIVVFHPLKRHVLCTRGRAMSVLAVLTLSALAYYSYAAWMSVVRPAHDLPTCQPKKHFVKVSNLLSGVDTVVTLIIPSVAIVFLNTCIFVKVAALYKRRREGSATDLMGNSNRSFNSGSSARNEHASWSCRGVGLTKRQGRHSEGSGEKGGSSPRGHRDRGASSTCDTLLLQRMNTTTCHVAQGKASAGQPVRPPHCGMSATRARGTAHAPDEVADSPAGTFACQVHTARPRRSMQLRTTRVLLLISTVFLLLNLPSHAFRVAFFIQTLRDERFDLGPPLRMLHEFCQVLYHMNFAANFFLYVAFSASFRQAFRKDCRRLWSALRRCQCRRWCHCRRYHQKPSRNRDLC